MFPYSFCQFRDRIRNGIQAFWNRSSVPTISHFSNLIRQKFGGIVYSFSNQRQCLDLFNFDQVLYPKLFIKFSLISVQSQIKSFRC